MNINIDEIKLGSRWTIALSSTCYEFIVTGKIEDRLSIKSANGFVMVVKMEEFFVKYKAVPFQLEEANQPALDQATPFWKKWFLTITQWTF